MRLFLIGPRGAGKTTAGTLAAGRLGVAFVDCDGEVERKMGMTVAEIFAREGEGSFRRQERQVLLDALQTGADAVVATGGGCVLDRQLRQGLQRQASQRRVIWLTAPIAVLAQRVARCPRPVLRPGLSPGAEMSALLREREPHYRACASTRIDTGQQSPEEVADVIQRVWATLSPADLR